MPPLPVTVCACPRASSRSAFTLVELLVVVSIIAVLVAMLLPALGKARAAAMNIKCVSQTRQFAISTISRCNDEHGYIPNSSTYSDQQKIMPSLGRSFRHGYLAPEALICPTAPTNYSWLWFSDLNPHDADDPQFKNFYNYKGIGEWNSSATTGNVNVPMGTYLYHAGAVMHQDAPTNPKRYFWHLPDVGFRMRELYVADASRYALLWDNYGIHAETPGESYAFFDGHARFISHDDPAALGQTGYNKSESISPLFRGSGYLYYYRPGTTPWHGFGLTPSSLATWTGQAAAVRDIINVP